MAKHQFQTEINQLLHLMIHSLYSDKDIILRELISNASDAMDKLQYMTVTDDNYKSLTFNPKIEIDYDKEKKIISISDSGIGMDEADLVEHLGTIAKSGTKSFLEKLSGDAKKDSNLIGQFGVGFYASFMVANKVEVLSKKAATDKAYLWTSEGDGSYEITEGEKENYGTTITLHLKDDAEEYTSQWKLESIIKKYSDHVAFPIMMKKEKYEDKETTTSIEQINKANALWRRSKSEITDAEYKEFYSAISHDNDEPFMHMHTKAEGAQEYITLFYIPKKAPMDMYRVDYAPGVKLYVKRVFITDNDKELLPQYLRFVRGIIDAEDLPLNVSREILQQNKLLANIKNASAKKILSELSKLSKADKAKYEEFYKEFGKALKEGLYSDWSNRDALMDLLRFKSTKSEESVSFEDYVSNMIADQKNIYYIQGQNANLLKNSPLLESFKAKNIEVLILDEDIDEIIMPTVTKYKDFDIKSVVDGIKDDIVKPAEDKESETKLAPLVEKLQKALGEEVKNVKVSSRLNDSPVCVVFEDGEMNPQMIQMLKAMGQAAPDSKPTLEINPKHPIVAKLESMSDEEMLSDVAEVLLTQGKLLAGMEIKNADVFSKKLNDLLIRAL